MTSKFPLFLTKIQKDKNLERKSRQIETVWIQKRQLARVRRYF
jgi:hypothetical protein